MSIFDDEDILNVALNENDPNKSFMGFDGLPQEESNNEGEGLDGETNIKVEPKKRATRNLRPRLTVEILSGPRGLHTIEDYFKNIQFKGKGSEKQDLDEIMKRLKHWGHRMYPNYKFDDILNNIERLGKKKALQVHMSRYRLGMLAEKTQELDKSLIDEVITTSEYQANKEYDKFDALLDEQIAISKISTSHHNNSYNNSSGNNYLQPAPTSSEEAAAVTSTQLTSEQRARIAENYRLAQERLAAKRASLQKL